MTDTPAGEQEAEAPNIARVYDYLLGGSHNFAADRAAGDQFAARWPEARQSMLANRGFLGRAVRYLAAEAGVRQFLDIGSGIPTMRNVHEVTRRAAPGTRVVYADIDPVAVLHSRAILASDDSATAIEADLRRPGEILAHPETLRLLDLSRPVAVLLVATLHFLPDSDTPGALVAELRDSLAAGSYLVLSHGTTDGQPPHVGDAATFYARTTAPFHSRGHAEILAFFDGFDLIPPGLVRVSQWRSDDTASGGDPALIAAYGGAGRKP